MDQDFSVCSQAGFADFRHTMSPAAAAKEETPLATQQRQMLCGMLMLLSDHRLTDTVMSGEPGRTQVRWVLLSASCQYSFAMLLSWEAEVINAVASSKLIWVACTCVHPCQYLLSALLHAACDVRGVCVAQRWAPG